MSISTENSERLSLVYHLLAHHRIEEWDCSFSLTQVHDAHARSHGVTPASEDMFAYMDDLARIGAYEESHLSSHVSMLTSDMLWRAERLT